MFAKKNYNKKKQLKDLKEFINEFPPLRAVYLHTNQIGNHTIDHIEHKRLYFRKKSAGERGTKKN